MMQLIRCTKNLSKKSLVIEGSKDATRRNARYDRNGIGDGFACPRNSHLRLLKELFNRFLSEKDWE